METIHSTRKRLEEDLKDYEKVLREAEGELKEAQEWYQKCVQRVADTKAELKSYELDTEQD